MFTLEERKKHTKYITELSRTSLYKITGNDAISGYILCLFHWIITGIPLLYLFIGKINKLYLVSCILWVIIMSMHFYFNGCILARIEKKLWNEPKWWGPWIFLFTPLEYTGLEMTTALANNIFICWGIIIILTVFLRVIHHIGAPSMNIS